MRKITLLNSSRFRMPKGIDNDEAIMLLFERPDTLDALQTIRMAQSGDATTRVELARKLHLLPLKLNEKRKVESIMLNESSNLIREVMAGNSRLTQHCLTRLSEDENSSIAARASDSLRIWQARSRKQQADAVEEEPQHEDLMLLNRHVGACLPIDQLYKMSYSNLEQRYGGEQGLLEDSCFETLKKMCVPYQRDVCWKLLADIVTEESIRDSQMDALSLLTSLCALQLTDQGDWSRPTLICSSQLSGQGLLLGAWSLATGIDVKRMQDGTLTAQDWKDLADKVAMLCDSSIYIVSDPMMTHADILSWCREIDYQCDHIGMVIMPADMAASDPEQVPINQRMNQLAHEFNSRVIALDKL